MVLIKSEHKCFYHACHCSSFSHFEEFIFSPKFWDGFLTNVLNVRKVAIQANLIRQQKVSTPRESSQTELFRFAMKRYSLLLEKLCKLHPNIRFFGPSRVYPKSVHSVHTPKLVDVFFKNKIGTPDTKILRNNLGFDEIPT